MNVPKAKTKPRIHIFTLYSLVTMAVCVASLLCMLFMLGRVVVIPEQHEQYNSLKFEDIVIDSLKGAGSVIVAYKVKIPKIDDQDYITKVTWEEYLEYSAIEKKTFRLLNEPPTSPSIPPLIFKIPSMSTSSPRCLKMLVLKLPLWLESSAPGGAEGEDLAFPMLMNLLFRFETRFKALLDSHGRILAITREIRETPYLQSFRQICQITV
jgi:hypothetical protein